MEGVPQQFAFCGPRYFLSVTLQASFLAAKCGTFPTKAEPMVHSYRIFLVKARHNRCPEHGVTENCEGRAQKIAAQDAVHRVAGVLDVANDIEVRPWDRFVRTDSDIAGAVRNALEWDFARLRVNAEPHQLAKDLSFEPLAANRWCAANSWMGLLKKQ